jgi:hypothetical protein
MNSLRMLRRIILPFSTNDSGEGAQAHPQQADNDQLILLPTRQIMH